MGNTLNTSSASKKPLEHPYWTRLEVDNFSKHFSSCTELTCQFQTCIITSFSTYVEQCFALDLGESVDSLDDVSMYLGNVMRGSNETLIKFLLRPVQMYLQAEKKKKEFEENGNEKEVGDTCKDERSLPVASLLFLSILFDWATTIEYTKDELMRAATKLHRLYLQWCQERGLSTEKQDIDDDDITNTMTSSLLTWMNECYPCLSKILLEKLQQICFHHYNAHTFVEPVLVGGCNIVSNLDILPLSCISDQLQGNWKRIYTTDTDGRSFNRVTYHLVGYDGPVIILIKCSNYEGTVLGAYAEAAFKDCNRYHGSRNNFLFTIGPMLNNVYRTSGRETNYQWLNTNSFGLPHGIGKYDNHLSILEATKALLLL